MSADPTENDAQGPGKELEPVDSEVTPVGGTSKKLLELSEGGDQNTRAYRAPRELLELARRQRALGLRHSQPAEARPSAAPPVPVHSAPPPAARPADRHQRGPAAAAAQPAAASPSLGSGQRSSRPSAPGSRASQQRSTAGRAADRDSSDVASSQKRRVRPVSLSPSDFSEGEAAPPRPIAEAVGPRDRPTRRPGRSEESVESSAPSISYQPASSRSAYSVEALERHAASRPGLVGDAAPPVARSRPSHALSSEPSSASPARPASSLAELVKATGDAGSAPSVPVPAPANDLDAAIPSSLSTDMTMARNRVYVWAIVFALFILLGFLLARWHVVDLVLPPAR